LRRFICGVKRIVSLEEHGCQDHCFAANWCWLASFEAMSNILLYLLYGKVLSRHPIFVATDGDIVYFDTFVCTFDKCSKFTYVSLECHLLDCWIDLLNDAPPPALIIYRCVRHWSDISSVTFYVYTINLVYGCYVLCCLGYIFSIFRWAGGARMFTIHWHVNRVVTRLKQGAYPTCALVHMAPRLGEARQVYCWTMVCWGWGRLFLSFILTRLFVWCAGSVYHVVWLYCHNIVDTWCFHKFINTHNNVLSAW
jgi:hypothetical protein